MQVASVSVTLMARLLLVSPKVIMRGREVAFDAITCLRSKISNIKFKQSRTASFEVQLYLEVTWRLVYSYYPQVPGSTEEWKKNRGRECPQVRVARLLNK